MDKQEYTGLEIAVVGMACKFPGASNINDFWENLKNGKETISRFSDEELGEYGIQEEELLNPNYVKAKGIIEGASFFDAKFFGISPKEANMLDPQLRVLLQCAYNALADAGYNFQQKNNNAGVFVGASPSVNWQVHSFNKSGNLESEQFSSLISNDKDFISTKLSYLLNLHGHSHTIYTACSTSLVAVDMACQSLLTGKCDSALAGGVSVSLPLKSGYQVEEGMIMSQDGHTCSFDKNATGTIWSDGAGIVVLKRLEDAIADGDQIHAVIKGSATNNDGNRKIGYTAPSIQGQTDVIKKAIRMAEVPLESIQYIEGHGSATTLGDKIEISALAEVFKNAREGFKCAIGSVKSNMGHLNVAAGIAGFIKGCLMVKHAQIPPSINYNTPNPLLQETGNSFSVNTQLTNWEENKYPLRLGVSSFGIGGTNAHVILERINQEVKTTTDQRETLICFSADTEAGVEQYANDLLDYIVKNEATAIKDIAYTLQTKRQHYRYRKAFVVKNREELIEKLSEVSVTRSATSDNLPVMMFPGMGGYYPTMSKDLYLKEPVFKEVMDECLFYIEKNTGKNCLPMILGDKNAEVLNDFHVPQLLVFSYEYALAVLLDSWGLNAITTIGYSLGEYVAACLSGVFDLETAHHILSERGRLMNQFEDGRMIAVPLTAEEVLPYIQEEVVIAVDNGQSVVLSGREEEVEKLRKKLKKDDILIHEILQGPAAHSPEMNAIKDEYKSTLDQYTFNPSKKPMLSNVTGDWRQEEYATTEYWLRHLAEQVQFFKLLKNLVAKHPRAVFFEMGVGNFTNILLRRLEKPEAPLKLVNLVRSQKQKSNDKTGISDHGSILKGIASFWQFGGRVDWDAYYKGYQRKTVSLPDYPFAQVAYDINIDISNTKKPGAVLTRKRNLSNWFYVPSWKRSPLTIAAQKSTKRNILLIESKSSDALVQLLKEQHTVITVNQAEKFQEINSETYQLDFNNKTELQQLFEALESTEISIDTILDFTSVLEKDAAQHSLERNVNFIQSLNTSIYIDSKIDYITLSSNLFSVFGNEQLDADKATLISSATVIPQENPNIQCRIIEIEPEVYRNQNIALFQKLAHELDATDKIISYRGFNRWQQYFESYPIQNVSPTESYIQEKGTYIIIGGLGDVGYTIANAILENNTCNVILVGRSVIPGKEQRKEWMSQQNNPEAVAQKIARLEALEDRFETVFTSAADVGSSEQMEGLVAHVKATYGSLQGIIFAAGDVSGMSLDLANTISSEQLQANLAAKKAGLAVLQQIVAQNPMDFTMVISSLSAIIGGIGMTGYAAMNQYVDTFVSRENAKQSATKWIGINYPYLNKLQNQENQISETVSEQENDRLKFEMLLAQNDATGNTTINNEESIGLFQRLFSKYNHQHQIAICPVDFPALIEKLQNPSIAQEEETTAEVETNRQRPLVDVPYVAPVTELEIKLAKIWEDVFGFEVGLEDDFFQLGGDSLGVIRLVSNIQKEFKIAIEVKKVFKNTSFKNQLNLLKNGAESNVISIEKAPVKEYYPQSEVQQGFFILHQMNPELLSYNNLGIIELQGTVAIERYENIFKQLIETHDILRTSFHIINDNAVQKIHTSADFKLQKLEIENNNIQSVIEKFHQPFNLEKPGLMRAGICKVNENKYYILTDIHHIILDRLTFGMIMRDFEALHRNEQLNPAELKYVDFAEWQQSEAHEAIVKEQEEFWLNEFNTIPEPLRLPTDFKRSAVKNYNAASVRFELTEEKHTTLQQICREEKVTMYTLLLSNYYLLLSKISNQQDIVIGTTLLGRPHKDLEKVMGVFAHALPVRSQINPENSFRTFLNEVKSNAFQCFANEEYSFGKLVGQLDITPDLYRNPLFDVMFEYYNFSEPDLEILGAEVITMKKPNITTEFDFCMRISLNDEGREVFDLDYRSDLYTKETIQRFVTYFTNILNATSNSLDVTLSAIDFLSQNEKKLLVEEYNSTELAYDDKKSLATLFEEQVSKNPEAIAAVYKEEKLTYAQLNERANQVAHYLISRGVVPGTNVGLLLDRSIDMIVGMLGVLKSGAGYLPLDPNLPEQRIGYMLDKSRSSFLLTKEAYTEQYTAYLPVKAIDAKKIKNQPKNNPGVELSSQLSAYCIFTSGSSGNPKGVLVNQQSVVNLVKGLENRVYEAFNNNKINVALLASFSFDASVQQIFGALLQGHSLYIIDDESRKDGKKLLDFYNSNQIDLSDGTPTHLRLLVNNLDENKRPQTLSNWILAGETLSKELVLEFHSHVGNQVQLHNFYGPTEACVDSTSYKIDIDALKQYRSIPIGKPLPNERIYITDASGALAPIGVAGELCIAGDGLAQRYIGDEPLTSERFNTDFIAWEDRVYRTGDLAKWLPDGNIEFIGRQDDQIKLRGYRIELPEIEYQLSKLKHIEDAVVLVKNKETDQKYLVAYYQSKEKMEVAELREQLAANLPDYMIPSFFVYMKAFPLTLNGKIDRKALPDHQIVKEKDYVAPTTKTEHLLVESWAEILKVNPDLISTKGSFFDYGGDSLNMVFLKNSINKKFAVTITLKQIITNPTVNNLANIIESSANAEQQEIAVAPIQEYYPLSPSQLRMYYLAQFDSESTAYNMPRVTTLKGQVNKSKLETTFKKLIERHEGLRTVFEYHEGTIKQRILQEVPFTIAQLENSGTIETTIREFVKPFDLAKAPLIRVGFIEKFKNECILIVDCHHIISDGVTSAILSKDFKALYEGEELAALPIQYKDFVMWQQGSHQQERLLKQKEYWLAQYAEPITQLTLPNDYQPAYIPENAGDTVKLNLDAAITAKLQDKAREENATLFAVLLSIYNVLLHKLSNQTDIVVGTSVSGRSHAALENIAGIFINTLALRSYPGGEKTFNTLLKEVSEHSFEAFENQDFPFESLTDALGITGALRSDLLFNVMFEFFSLKESGLSISDFQEEAYDFFTQGAKFDISLRITELDGTLEVNFDYRKSLFKRETIEKWVSYFQKLITIVINREDFVLNEVTFLTTNEIERLQTFNETHTEYDRNSSIPDIFKRHVALNPERTAICYNNKKVSYKELDILSDNVAAYLVSEGVVTGSLVALLFDRSIEMVVSMLGVLKTGAAYLPLETSIPEDRIKYMLEQSRASFLLYEKDYADAYKNQITCGTLDFSTLHKEVELPVIDVKATETAYCIFTSGSTGQPKGVMMPHRGVINLVEGLEERVYSAYNDRELRVSLLASFIFDASAQQIYGSLLQGHSLYIIDDEARKDGARLLNYYNENYIDVSDGTPTHLGLLVNAVTEGTQLNSLSSWILAGEVLSKSVVSRFYSHFGESTQLYNFYGPTETCVDSTSFKVKFAELDKYQTIPIGRPLPNERAYVADKTGKLVPIGVFGELCIAGDGLAQRYIGNPAATAEKFQLNWIEGEEMVYRTGDVVRWLPDGNLEFQGRRDAQVKLRGYRIELTEIARQIETIQGIRRSVVMLKEKEDDQFLVGYYESDEPLTTENLRSQLAKSLPMYMIPSYFVHSDQFPVGPTGKIDARRLPDFTFVSEDTYVAPGSDAERQLITIWSDILNVNEDAIGIHTDFFDLGGNSLKASTLVNKIYEAFSLKVDIKTIYEEATISTLAGIIEESKEFLAVNSSYEKSEIKQTFEI